MSVRRGLNQHQFFNRLTGRKALRDQKHTRAGTGGQKKITEMPRHRVKIVRHDHAILRRRPCEHLGVGQAFQVRVVCGEEPSPVACESSRMRWANGTRLPAR
jgi:hypothetical protein